MPRQSFLLLMSAALFVAAQPSLAQDKPANTETQSAAASTSSAPAASSPTTQPKPKKKVWTNDDVNGLRGGSGVSVVGESKPNTKPTYYSNPGQSDYAVRMYRQQIDQLQAQIEAIDKEIANLRAAMSGKTVDTSRKYDPWGGKQGDWNSQIDQLQKNRQYLLQQIDSLESQIKKLNP